MQNSGLYFMRATYTLEKPMGVYKDYPEVGILNFNEDGSISGNFSGGLEEIAAGEVEGTWIRAGMGDLQMTLLKRGPGSSLDIVYFLGKGDGRDSIRGSYKGYWRYVHEDRSVKKTRARMVLMTLDSEV